MDGRDDLAEYHRVEFRGSLADVVGGRRFGLYVITHPDAGGVLSPRGRGDRWGFAREWRPGQLRLPNCRREQLVTLIGTAVGVPQLPLDIQRTTSFSFAAQIADRYRNGRCFLVGDAAHRMTPRGGTGMNTAIQDANDLAWKLGWVLRGWARHELLDSYEVERRPVGLHNVGRTADPDGARREAADALPWDLNSRGAHAWVHHDGHPVSTLDLLDQGLTLLTGPNSAGWAEAASSLKVRAPVSTHTLDAAAATALELEPAGAILVRPDAKQIAQWPSPTPLIGDPLPLL